MPLLLSHFLDACRWIGALIVLGVHATNMFVNLGDIMSAPHNPAVYGWWFFVSYELGHHAVVGFFVMSGFLVGGAALASLRKSKDFLREYLIHRVARIYMVTGPAVAVTILLDNFGRGLFGDTGVYGWPMFTGHYALPLALGNLANVQEIYFPYYGTNGPLWSLACEFWYYVTFPLLLLPLARNYSPLVRYGGCALGIALLIALSIPDSWFKFGYVLWAMGAAATLAPRPLIRSRWVSLGLLVAVLIPIRLLVRGALLAEHPWLQEAVDMTSAAFFLNLMVTLRYGPTEGWDFCRPMLHKTFADFSFSLYCIHMPALIFARAAAESYFGVAWVKQLATPQHWALLGVVMATIVLAAYGFSLFTEAKTLAARDFLRAKLPKFRIASA